MSGGVLVVAVFSLAVAAYAWPSDSAPPSDTTIVGNTEEFEPGSVTALWPLGVPAHLVRLESGEFLAFHAAEPVNGCAMPWQPRLQAFRDPCRGFAYDVTGEPSPDNAIRMPMTQFDVDIDRTGTIRVTAPVDAQ